MGFMWIACPTQTESHLDRFLALSPEVYLGPPGYALIDLGGVAPYWKLHRLAHDFQREDWEHPLLVKLQELRQKTQLSFVIAPTATWAFFIAKNFPSSGIDFWPQQRTHDLLSTCSLNLARDFLCDLLEQSHEARNLFEDFRLYMDELGFSQLGQLLLNFSTEHALGLRFGRPIVKLMQRLRGQSELEFLQYEPKPLLEERFYPTLEADMSSERQSSLLPRLEEILRDWEERLRARHSLLCGLHVELHSYRERKSQTVSFKLPRPSRDPQILLKILQEKVAFGEFDIERVLVRSLGLQIESDRQLNLFNPQREEVLENWGLLFSKLQARGGGRIGSYQAFPSYFPERSMEWVDWEENFKSEVILDHPPRPQTLLREPKPLCALSSEIEFFEFLQKSPAYAAHERSLERIRDSLSNCERTYARLGSDWVFWDSGKKKLFLHGYFE